MKGYVQDIEELTGENTDFRRVLYTGKYLQLVLMALKPGEDIGAEVHEDHDQFFRVEKGEGDVVIDGQHHKIKGDDAIVVPAGARHNVINTGHESLKLYTLYGPPNHRDGVVRATKAEAEASEEHFDGKTTEQLQARPTEPALH
jgi:mannose-6-phosphate isomerase-like protein (cupin superfamily)